VRSYHALLCLMTSSAEGAEYDSQRQVRSEAEHVAPG
jgi:hypothetical protein